MKLAKKCIVLVGCAFGDEGKGKVIDQIAHEYKNSLGAIVRYSGGPNAGHTIYQNDKKIILRQIPSGVLHDTKCMIGCGCVVDPYVLKSEIDQLNEIGIDIKSKLVIAANAHVILPQYIAEETNESKIGTTKKGIGPCYRNKINRTSFRVMDFANNELEFADHNFLDKEFFSFTKDLFTNQMTVSNVSIDIIELIKKGKYILLEGAQGTLLDIDHGSYPFVTSSSSISGGACTGAGISPLTIKKVIGVTKAYMTRVGNGPFYSEIEDQYVNKLIRDNGNEYGSVTKRPRRVGWLDLPALKYAVLLNGVTDLVMTKLDVLTGCGDIYTLTNYFKEGDKRSLKEYPDRIDCSVFDRHDGWLEDISQCHDYKFLPDATKRYVEFVEKFVGVTIKSLSVGPGRDDIIELV